jgi:hypothetical protein
MAQSRQSLPIALILAEVSIVRMTIPLPIEEELPVQPAAALDRKE